MSLFPSGLWQPSHKDLVTEFSPTQHFELAGATASSVAMGITLTSIPKDNVLLLSGLFGVAVPGAGQNVTRLRLRLGFLNSAGTFVGLVDFKATGTIVGAANAEVAIDWQCGPPGFPVMPQQLLAFNGDFNAAAVANVLSFSAYGVLIPRGNWQRA